MQRLRRKTLTGKHNIFRPATFNLGKNMSNHKPPLRFRDDIVQAMNSYLNRQFRKGTTEFAVYSSGDGNEMRVDISCHNLNFKSYWGGEWISSWVLDVVG
jgi:hypothetical protein